MPVKNSIYVTTPQKPDVAEVGKKPSVISNEEFKKLPRDQQIAINKATIQRSNQEFFEKCMAAEATSDETVESHKVEVVRKTIARLAEISQIPEIAVECNTLSKISKFMAKAEAAIMGPVELATETYDDLLVGLEFLQNKVNELANFCDDLDTSTDFGTLSGEAGFLGIVDVAIDLADPALWQKLAECGVRLATLPSSILSQATHDLAGKSIESMVIIANTVETTKLSNLEDALKASASIVGNSADQLTHFDSLIALAGFTKEQLIASLPFGFNPGEDIIFAQEVYKSAKDGNTLALEDYLPKEKQLMARTMVDRATSPKSSTIPTSGNEMVPAMNYMLSDSSGIREVKEGVSPSTTETLSFGDTWQDQTGVIHILNDRLSTEEKIDIFKNNKKARSRKLNPIPQPIQSYA